MVLGIVCVVPHTSVEISALGSIHVESSAIETVKQSLF